MPKTAVCVLLAAALLAGEASAATLTVDDDGPADFGSIQSAINGAINGDEILVKPGRYRETVNFLGKSLTVRSEQGPARTVIFLEGETRIIRLNGDSTLRGFTITGGRARVGGGIYVTDGAQPSIEDNIIENNTAEWNGVLPAFGGGIAVDLAAAPVITRNVIRGNLALGDVDGSFGYGGGIDVGDYTSATITNNLILDNEASDSGGGISVGLNDNADPVEIVNNTLVGNRAGLDGHTVATLGGGIVLDADFTGEVRNNALQGNTADDGGGIIFLGGGLQGILYENNDFDGNTPNDCANLPGSKCSQDQFFLPPLFVDPAGGDYRLRFDSGLIDIGTGAGAPSVDLAGRARPVDGDLAGGATPDIGAWENQGEVTRLRFDSKTDLSWDGSANLAVTFDVYRDPLSALGPLSAGTCWQTGLGATTTTDLSEPLPGEGRFYLVAGQDLAVGSLGFTSDGTQRTPGFACP